MWGRKGKDREPEVVHVVAAHDGESPRWLGESQYLSVAEYEAAFSAVENPDTVISLESYVDYPAEWLKKSKRK
jgi:hypothetical protein